MTLRCEGTYQGIPIKACQFRRSVGLHPEYSSVDMDFSDLGQINVEGRDVPWRALGGLEMNGQIDIRSWAKIKPGTTATPPDLPAPRGGGLNMFGALRLRTIDDDTGAVIEEVAYHEVYVAASGIEEVTKGLAQREDHNKGTIRIPLTDIRWWFQKCGGLWGGINVRLKSGAFDKGTVKDGGEPWSFAEVLRYMFSQLPGTPHVISSSEAFSMGGQPPADIIGEGEPVIEHLQKLLDRYGLAAGMRPDASWTVDRKGSNRFGYKEGPSAGGGTRDLDGLPTHDESKTVMITDRPPAVCVTGPRRVRRISVPYVPVLEDTDGNIYRMEAVVKRWGYSMGKLNNNVMVASERQFRDVPPTLNMGSGQLHEARVKLIRRAYRMYAPAFLFEGAADSTSESAPGASEQLTDNSPYLPMMDAPWYRRELGAFKIPKDTAGKAGDQDDYVLLPPLVRGLRLGSAFFTNIKEIDGYFDNLVSANIPTIELLDDMISVLTQQQSSVARSLAEMSSTARRTISSGKLSEYGAGSMPIEWEKDVKDAAGEVGVTLGSTTVNQLIDGGAYLKRMIRELVQMISSAKKTVGGIKDLREKWKRRYDSFKDVYKEYGGIYCRYNVPYGFLDAGSYSIDMRTGVLQASEPLCQINQPIFFDGDNVKVISDACLTVTFGYELKDNTIAAYSSFLFAGSDTAPDAPGRAVLAGVCKSSPLKAWCMPMNARIYEMDMGTPVNLNACAAEAWQKAGSILGQPKVVTGYSYEFSGLYNFPLAAGVSGVQHILDGHFGRTVLMINAAGTRAPLGPAALPRRDVATVDAGEGLRREASR
jgi:hypothetical protein